MFDFSTWSLMKRSLFGLNIISSSLILCASTLAYNYQGQVGKQALNQKISSLFDYVKHASSQAIWNFDVALLNTYAQQLIVDEDIVAVEFKDKSNKVISNAEKQPFAGFPSLERTVASPSKADDIIGSVTVYYSYESVDSALRKTLYTVIGASVFFQGLLSLAMFFFLGRASKRLEISVGMLKETATQARNSGSTLKDLSADLSKKGSTQAAAIEQTSSTLNELSSILSKTVESSEKAFQMATASYDFASKGQSENQGLQIAMAEISEGASKIQEIISVVEDIAFQTNILALNAAVEAARAGEQGKGFAVVADAVRTLAQKSTVAAKDISSLILESTNRVEKGKKLVESNLEIFEGILKSAQEVKTINQELLANTQEQSVGINQITKAMLEIDQVVSDSSQSTAETANHADTMAQQSEFLSEVVQNFENEIKGKVAA